MRWLTYHVCHIGVFDYSIVGGGGGPYLLISESDGIRRNTKFTIPLNDIEIMKTNIAKIQNCDPLSNSFSASKLAIVCPVCANKRLNAIPNPTNDAINHKSHAKDRPLSCRRRTCTERPGISRANQVTVAVDTDTC